ncbi:hypothetical protein NUW58_g1695 [Xylaria curta]|uniref:Uncharacterized protein n=1 Tax=Xylaria curta TaxID=42375 RepID=A0ACC1PJK8_9PEZI|nr:hypothetical protein NUW58_g1695 [Xylaria curta]
MQAYHITPITPILGDKPYSPIVHLAIVRHYQARHSNATTVETAESRNRRQPLRWYVFLSHRIPFLFPPLKSSNLPAQSPAANISSHTTIPQLLTVRNAVRHAGKSSLAVQFVDGHFVESYYPTIENTFSKVIRFKGQDYTTEIVDTAGQDEYSILNSKHFIGIHGYMLVYSVSSLPSFEMVQVIREKILNHLVRHRPLSPLWTDLSLAPRPHWHSFPIFSSQVNFNSLSNCPT